MSIMINENVKIMFGTGDIILISGYDKEKEIGYVFLDNQDPRPIGLGSKDGTIKHFQHRKIIDEQKFVNQKDIPIIISFTKIESIQSLIDQLEDTKKLMINKLDGFVEDENICYVFDKDEISLDVTTTEILKIQDSQTNHPLEYFRQKNIEEESDIEESQSIDLTNSLNIKEYFKQKNIKKPEIGNSEK